MRDTIRVETKNIRPKAPLSLFRASTFRQSGPGASGKALRGPVSPLLAAIIVNLLCRVVE